MSDVWILQQIRNIFDTFIDKNDSWGEREIAMEIACVKVEVVAVLEPFINKLQDAFKTFCAEMEDQKHEDYEGSGLYSIDYEDVVVALNEFEGVLKGEVENVYDKPLTKEEFVDFHKKSVLKIEGEK